MATVQLMMEQVRVAQHDHWQQTSRQAALFINKSGSAKRKAKKYYKDQYRKTGIIPAPLLLVEKGIMEGRMCSGRPRSIDEQTKRRFIEMVKASSDPSSQGFIFITQKARIIKNYHHWLKKELGRSISLAALRRCAKRENLKFYLEKPDFEEDVPVKSTLKILNFGLDNGDHLSSPTW